MTYHKLFKFIIVGDKYVGKTSILNKWLDPFRDIQLYQNTIGVEFGSKISVTTNFSQINNIIIAGQGGYGIGGMIVKIYWRLLEKL